ncbi:MAG: 50S ribosomal protein L22 [candidate division Zixibacteria bacterium]|nr:50S ribosomal protein L22 [candidate division Zixibacteria bacterium]
MQATARLRYVMMSPRKLRRVVSLIRGKSVDEALTILKYTHKAAAGPLAKTIQSATANALAIEGTSRLKAEDLSIAKICVDEGPRAKRVRFRAMGRVYRYKKPFAHVTVVVEGVPHEQMGSKKRAAAGEKPEKAEAAPGIVKKIVRRRGTKAAPEKKARAVKKTPAKKTAPVETETPETSETKE